MKKYLVVWSQWNGSDTVEHQSEIAAYCLRDALSKWERMSYCNACVKEIRELSA